MTRACGKDIVKKPSTRKGRYLLAFNFQLAPAAAGRLVWPSRRCCQCRAVAPMPLQGRCFRCSGLPTCEPAGQARQGELRCVCRRRTRPACSEVRSTPPPPPLRTPAGHPGCPGHQEPGHVPRLPAGPLQAVWWVDRGLCGGGGGGAQSLFGGGGGGGDAQQAVWWVWMCVRRGGRPCHLPARPPRRRPAPPFCPAAQPRSDATPGPHGPRCCAARAARRHAGVPQEQIRCAAAGPARGAVRRRAREPGAPPLPPPRPPPLHLTAGFALGASPRGSMPERAAAMERVFRRSILPCLLAHPPLPPPHPPPLPNPPPHATCLPARADCVQRGLVGGQHRG